MLFSTLCGLCFLGCRVRMGVFRGWVARVDARRKLPEDRGHLRGAGGEVRRWIVHRDGSPSLSLEHAVEGVYTRRSGHLPRPPCALGRRVATSFRGCAARARSSPSTQSTTWSWTQGPRTGPSNVNGVTCSTLGWSSQDAQHLIETDAGKMADALWGAGWHDAARRSSILKQLGLSHLRSRTLVR